MSTNEQHEDQGGAPRGWEPIPQSEGYDGDATAFVQLPPDFMLDGVPLEAPGHGYVPPMITPLQPLSPQQDPTGTGSWSVHIPAQAEATQYFDGTSYGEGEYVEYPEQQVSYGPTPGQEDQRSTAEWHYPGTAAPEPASWPAPAAPEPGHEPPGGFTASAVRPYAEAPGTLPGGAQAPWAVQEQEQAYAYGPEHGQVPEYGQPPVMEHGRRPVAEERPEEHHPAAEPDPAATAPAPERTTAPEAPRPADPAPASVSEQTPDQGTGYETEYGAERAPEYAPGLPPGQATGYAPGQASGYVPEQAAEYGAGHAPEYPAGHAPEQASAYVPETPEQASAYASGHPSEQASEHAPDHPGEHPAEPAPETSSVPLPGPERETGQGATGGPEQGPAGGREQGPARGPGQGVEQDPAERTAETDEGSRPAPEPGTDPASAAPAAPGNDTGRETAPEPVPVAVPEHEQEHGQPHGHAPAPEHPHEPAPVSEAAPVSEPAPVSEAEQVSEAEPAPALVPFSSTDSDEHPHTSYILRVNGTDRPVTGSWIGESLLYVLRERLGLAGAKDGCSQGECGACNVQVDGRLVASCLVPAATAAGSEVRTVEGLAVDGEPSDVQRAMAKCGAVQCGFCIPGMCMTVHDLLEGNHAPTDLEARQALAGNLCRCSGYQSALTAVREVIAEREASAAAAHEAADDGRVPHQIPHAHDGGMA
ncbi:MULTISPECIES: 2Fe-2S iron-sulfur cluster-binding protein [unclassified Streptomyces]|uniref:2Fe-2S iron-sulfur cluster-binding protein n=1 Tax=unclassified Streptomyces TaxID=2593676 RepID=UPI001660E30A|nr:MULTISPECIES: 2Fe-2S iron-sulfur cluster-binding protein [unclassified Streptomyces]MBD0708128.1 hypothetical protein [Streptomyces sp. CBMA291]MBD0714696.1 hypothetical protein [Streptomyces sp. CBMA370]